MWTQFLRDFFLATPKLMVQKHDFCAVIGAKKRLLCNLSKFHVKLLTSTVFWQSVGVRGQIYFAEILFSDIYD